jgi:hypothetical protein
MGKMKEIFMEVREQEADQEQIEQASVFDSGIMCPNCFKANLIEFSQHDLYCESCGQDFVRVENSIRFK